MSKNSLMTVERVRESLPVKYRATITQKVIDRLNKVCDDPRESEVIVDNFVTYASVLNDGKYKLNDYLNAIKYVTFQMLSGTNLEAYRKTFPDRYKSMVDKGKTNKDISSFVTAYNKGELVNKIREVAIIPIWLLNSDKLQAAVNTQFEIIKDVTVSPKVRVEAANSLLTHLKKPDKIVDNSINVNINNDGMKTLEDALTRLSQQQLNKVNDGVALMDVVSDDMVIEGDFVDAST